jgi:hypothetical protein
VTLHPPPDAGFARNDVNFIDRTGVDHDQFGAALRKALYNYMHGIGLELDVREWFEPLSDPARAGRSRRRHRAYAVPATTVPRDLIERMLA